MHLVDMPPWYSSVAAKPVYENDWVKAFWGVPVCVEYVEVYSVTRDELALLKRFKKVYNETKARVA